MNETSLPKAKDLMQESPRSPRQRLGGYVIMARMADKGRASFNGTNAEYHFNCPLDNMLFSYKGVNGGDVQHVLLSGASDEELLDWFNTHGTPKTPDEIKAWSDHLERFSYYDAPGKTEWFSQECRQLGLDPSHASLFDMLETDDRESHKLMMNHR